MYRSENLKNLFESSIALVALVGVFSISFVSLLALGPKNTNIMSSDVAVNEKESVDKVNVTLISELTADQSYLNTSEKRELEFKADLDSFSKQDNLSFQIKMENLSDQNIVLEPIISSTENVDIFNVSITRLSDGEEDNILKAFATTTYEIKVNTKESVNYPVKINISLKY